MKTIYALIPLFFVFCTKTVLAQCATGVDTGGECVPPDELNPQHAPVPRHQPPQPPAVWSDRWGAIFIDYKTGQAGTTVGQESKQKANEIAMNSCSKNGSPNCELVLSFHNQCAAVSMGGGGFGYAGAPTKEKAESLATNQCGRGDACKIVYSACSLPVRIQ